MWPWHLRYRPWSYVRHVASSWWQFVPSFLEIQLCMVKIRLDKVQSYQTVLILIFDPYVSFCHGWDTTTVYIVGKGEIPHIVQFLFFSHYFQLCIKFHLKALTCQFFSYRLLKQNTKNVSKPTYFEILSIIDNSSTYSIWCIHSL